MCAEVHDAGMVDELGTENSAKLDVELGDGTGAMLGDEFARMFGCLVRCGLIVKFALNLLPSMLFKGSG